MNVDLCTNKKNMINKSKKTKEKTVRCQETHFKPVGQGAQQLDLDGQANECGHAAVGYGGRKLDAHCALIVIDLDRK